MQRGQTRWFQAEKTKRLEGSDYSCRCWDWLGRSFVPPLPFESNVASRLGTWSVARIHRPWWRLKPREIALPSSIAVPRSSMLRACTRNTCRAQSGNTIPTGRLVFNHDHDAPKSSQLAAVATRVLGLTPPGTAVSDNISMHSGPTELQLPLLVSVSRQRTSCHGRHGTAPWRMPVRQKASENGRERIQLDTASASAGFPTLHIVGLV